MYSRQAHYEDSFIFSLYFYKGKAQNGKNKENCLCIIENQTQKKLFGQVIDSQGIALSSCLKAKLPRSYGFGH